MESISRNKELIRSLYLQCLNQRRLNLLEDIFHEEYEGQFPGKGPSVFETGVKNILDAFPELEFELLDLIAEHDRVVARWQWKGVHRNAFRKFPASGKEVVNNGITIFEFKNGKVIRSWIQNEKLELLQQIGVVNL